jgi:hypothetical protein
MEMILIYNESATLLQIFLQLAKNRRWQLRVKFPGAG